MFAIGHAATALIVKRKYPDVPILPLLVSVQLMEFLWVVFNYIGVEKTTTERTVKSVSDIHLAFIPYSHSIASGVGLALLSWLLVAKGLQRPKMGYAVAIGVLSHLVLDLITHAPDIAIAPGMDQPKFGLGLYNSAPLVAFVIEMVYGVICWRVYRGGKSLLAVIVFFNLANLSLLSASVPGPEELLAGRPMWVVTLIAVQIVVTLALVGILSKTRRAELPVPDRA
jgi:membrane-bound metal-dependent hydrolase YbcI (DUF457 family)